MRSLFLCLIAGIMFTGGIGTTFAQTNIPSLRLDDETRKLLREATEDKWFKKDALFSTLIGGLLAAVGGFGAVRMAHRLQAKHKEQEDSEFKANVLGAIRRELEAMGAIYEKGIGGLLRPLVEGQMFQTRLALTQDWFTVFSANAVHLGRLDAESSRRIVTIYTLLKGLIEEFRINNEYLETWNELEIVAIVNGGKHPQPARHQQMRDWLVAQAIKLRAVTSN